ncbi:hypothetical protein D9M68_543620 [compost metagenome]
MFDERHQFGVVRKRDAGKLPGETSQHRVEEVLRTTFALLRALRWVFLLFRGREHFTTKLMTVQRGDPSAVLRIVPVVTGTLDPIHDSPAATEFHGADTHHVHLRLLYLAIGPLQQHALDPTESEVARQSQANGTRANNQYRSFHCSISP